MSQTHPAAPRRLTLEPLTSQAFAPFGEVIEAGAATLHYPINDGRVDRYHDLARIDVGAQGGRALVSIFRARPQALPLQLSLVERHLLGSQAFMPLAPLRFVVVVAAPGPAPGIDALRGFVAAPGQGINLSRGTWHHPLLAVDQGGDFLVIDRGGPGDTSDCEVLDLRAAAVWVEV